MKREYIIETHKSWYRSLAERYPDLTEENDMPASELYHYFGDNLINRREIPYLPCELEEDDGIVKVYSRYGHKREYIGQLKRAWNKDDPFVIMASKRLRVEGGQKIKVTETKGGYKKEIVYLPYVYVLEMHLADHVINGTRKSVF